MTLALRKPGFSQNIIGVLKAVRCKMAMLSVLLIISATTFAKQILNDRLTNIKGNVVANESILTTISKLPLNEYRFENSSRIISVADEKGTALYELELRSREVMKVEFNMNTQAAKTNNHTEKSKIKIILSEKNKAAISVDDVVVFKN